MGWAGGLEARCVVDESLRRRLSGILLVVLATLCWSTSGILVRWVIAGSGLSAVGLAFWRDLTTFVVLLLGLCVIKPELLHVERADLPWLAAMGALSIGAFHVMWNIVVLLIGVSVATVIHSNAPIFVTIMAWILWREPIRPLKIAAIVLAVTGIALIAQLNDLAQSDISVPGVLIALVSAVAYGSFTLFGKKLTGSYSSWTVLAYAFGFAALGLLPFQFGEGFVGPFQGEAILVFATLVFVPTVSGFGLYTLGLGRLPANVASITANTEVPFAALLSYVLLGERLTLTQVIGALLVLGGVVLVSLPRRQNSPILVGVEQSG